MLPYMACFTEAHRVHASSYDLHSFLWQGHKSRLLPLNDGVAQTQLSNVTLTQNKNVTCLLAMAPVGNCHTHTHTHTMFNLISDVIRFTRCNNLFTPWWCGVTFFPPINCVYNKLYKLYCVLLP